MKYNILHTITAALCLITASLLGSCTSSNEDLLNTVPHDAGFAVTINLERLAYEGDFSFDNGRIQLPSELSAFQSEIPDEISAIIADCYNAINPERVILFGKMDRGEPTITFAIKDRNVLDEKLKNMTRTDKNGYAVYEANKSTYIIIRDNQGWIVNGKRGIGQLMDDLEKAAKENILKYSGPAEVLTSNNDVNVVANISEWQFTGTDYWVVSAGNIHGAEAKTVTRVISPEGEELTMNDNMVFDLISKDFLKYVAPNSIGVIALGFNKDFDWSAYSSIMMMSGLPRNQISTITSLLNAIDGTVSISVAPKKAEAFNWSLSNTKDWTATTTVQIEETEVTPLLEQIKALAEVTAMTVTDVTDTSLKVTVQDIVTDIRYTDGMLVLSVNTPIKPTVNDFAPFFNDKYLSTIIRIPKLNTVLPDCHLNFGYELTYAINETELVSSIKVTDSDLSLMESVYKIFSEANTYLKSGKVPDQDYESVVVEEVVL